MHSSDPRWTPRLGSLSARAPTSGVRRRLAFRWPGSVVLTDLLTTARITLDTQDQNHHPLSTSRTPGDAHAPIIAI